MAETPLIYAEAIVLLSAAVISAPIFKRIGLGTVLGYLAAGVVIGPILKIISDGEDILHFAELGIVFLLFIVGLEMKPSKLWSMRRDILGLGTLQVGSCGLLLTLLFSFLFQRWEVMVVAGFGLALSSTAFVLQTLESRGEQTTPYGRKTFSVLLYQDIAIIPMLAIIPLFATYAETDSGWSSFLIGLFAISIVILAGRYLLNPLLNIIALTGAKEAMIAAALLVVIGSATLMQFAGLSMALGSFLAGVLLAESSYRLELEANIEPFRGILLGLFFMAIGLSLEIEVLLENWVVILLVVPLAMAVKSIAIYICSRLFGSSHADSVRIAAILSQHGEFGFVLFAAAASIGVFNHQIASFLIAIVVFSMALTPLSVWLGELLLEKVQVPETVEEDFEGAESPVLMIGFSRMGQIASQVLLASGTDVTIIDNNTDMIKQAARFGFRIYFGDGTRKDVLIAAGIKQAKLVAICTHSPEITNRIVDLVAHEFPDKPLYVRSYDRTHTLQLMERDVTYHIRETFESAIVFGAKMLQGLGIGTDESEQIATDVRRLDEKRLYVQFQEGIHAGTDMMHNRPLKPEPLVQPAHPGEALDERSKEFVDQDDRVAEDADDTADDKNAEASAS